jgi:hypothetical protein
MVDWLRDKELQHHITFKYQSSLSWLVSKPFKGTV